MASKNLADVVQPGVEQVLLVVTVDPLGKDASTTAHNPDPPPLRAGAALHLELCNCQNSCLASFARALYQAAIHHQVAVNELLKAMRQTMWWGVWIDRFGSSAPGPLVLEKFGFTHQKIGQGKLASCASAVISTRPSSSAWAASMRSNGSRRG